MNMMGALYPLGLMTETQSGLIIDHSGAVMWEER